MTLLIGFLVPLGIVISAYMVYKVSKNPSVIDIAWGLNVIGSVIWYITQFDQSLDTINIYFYALPIFWGLRLSMHISFRVLTEELDGRYAAFEKKWSSENKDYKNPDKNYLQFFYGSICNGFYFKSSFLLQPIQSHKQ
jgi:steroid 5-alpha reductase family enzyme